MQRAIAFTLCLTLAAAGCGPWVSAGAQSVYSTVPPPTTAPPPPIDTLPPVSVQSPLPDLGDPAQAGLSLQAEKKIGESVMREYRRDPDFVDDPEVVSYVNSVGQRLVAVSADAGREFEFFVVRDNTINAFAMPGGFVGVHTGLLLAAQTESELAGVLAHEISHVTQRHIARQLEKGSQLSWAAIAGLVVAVLAARSNPQASQAAMAGTQAGAIQAMLNYSRDFEREADRVGFTLMEAAGYDPNGMPAFFERLQRATRLAELNAAPAYLRTHPLTEERMADLQARASAVHYRQRSDSVDFYLVRAKLRAQDGAPPEAVKAFENQLKEGRYANEGAAHYGLATALLRARNFKRAESELSIARTETGPHPMLETLGARIKRDSGDLAGARDQLTRALKDFGQRTYLVYEYAETLQALNAHREAITVLDKLVRERPHDARAYQMLAKSHAALGHIAWQHRAQGEYYALSGSLPAAIEQMQLAQRAGDGDFYLLSSVDARLRELKVLDADERKAKR